MFLFFICPWMMALHCRCLVAVVVAEPDCLRWVSIASGELGVVPAAAAAVVFVDPALAELVALAVASVELAAVAVDEARRRIDEG